MTTLHTRPSRKRGQALAEMAVMVPFLVICMMGMLDLGRAFYYQIAITNAVREAARYAAQPYFYGLNPACNTIPPAPDPGSNCPTPGDGNVRARVRQELAGIAISMPDANIQISPDQSGRVSNYNGATPTSSYPITVTASYQFNFITPIIGDLIGNPLTIKSSAVMRAEY
jgi:hypothetical protein